MLNESYFIENNVTFLPFICITVYSSVFHTFVKIALAFVPLFKFTDLNDYKVFLFFPH